jgi:DNA-binding transcriptional regulator YiaG
MYRFLDFMKRAQMQDVCPSTAQNTHVYVKTLHEACLILGGEHKLARHLGVPVELVEEWLNGRDVPSEAVFLRCVDLVMSR